MNWNNKTEHFGCFFVFFAFFVLAPLFFFGVKKINAERADCPKTTYHCIALSLMHDEAVGVWEGRDWGGWFLYRVMMV